jgi:hypothetical protein
VPITFFKLAEVTKPEQARGSTKLEDILAYLNDNKIKLHANAELSEDENCIEGVFQAFKEVVASPGF